MEQKVCLRLLWQKTKKDEACLVRVFGNYNQTELPDAVFGCPLTEIAPYCFAQSAHFPPGEILETEIEIENTINIDEITEASNAHLHELCGSYVTRIDLPDTVRSIGNYAFYNCRNLSRLCLGKNTAEFGSDVFMNCLELKHLVLRCGTQEKTGLKQILSQISGNLEVSFLSCGSIEAVLYYPEYTETYDEIAPAHIFGRGITGEGFRARQGFTEGKIDFGQYDAVFARAGVDETVSVLLRMAVNRLQYPAGLSGNAKMQYGAYVKAHDIEAVCQWVKQKDISLLEFLVRAGYVSKAALSHGILLASSLGWIEGGAQLMHLMRELEEDMGRYEFDDF